MTTVKAGSVPPQMSDPTLLEPDEAWTHTCNICHGYIQGGRAGLYAHVATVHGGGVADE